MNFDVLTSKAKELFPKLSNFKEEFYLAGGTSLALQIGHRISVDFDLFSDKPIKKGLLKEIENIFGSKKPASLVNNSDELTVIIDGVKFTFLYYPFPVILPFVHTDPMDLLSVKEILASKAYTIGRRGELKDYLDLYFGLKYAECSLSNVIDLTNKKFGESFNDRLFLEQLIYLDDLDDIKIIPVNEDAPSKSDLLDFFKNIIQTSRLLK